MKIHHTALLLGALALAACSDDAKHPDWEPGQVSTAPGIYFPEFDNILSVSSEGVTTVEIPVKRISDDGELTVPVVGHCDNPNVRIPESIKFADGSFDASIALDLSVLTPKTLTALSLTFPDEYINPYAAGVAAYEGHAILSDWMPVKGSPLQMQWCEYTLEPTSTLDPYTCEVLNLDGTDRYRVVNFLGTGYNFTFDLQPSTYPLWGGYSRIIPLGNQVLYSQYGWASNYNDWWFVSDDLSEWPELQLYSGGNPVTIYGMTFGWYDDSNKNEYAFSYDTTRTDEDGVTRKYRRFFLEGYGYYNSDWDWQQGYTGYLYHFFEYELTDDE